MHQPVLGDVVAGQLADDRAVPAAPRRGRSPRPAPPGRRRSAARRARPRRARRSAPAPRPWRRRRCRGSARPAAAPSGSVASQRASSTFCWLPPDSSPTRWSRAGRLDPQPLHERVDDPVDARLGDQPAAGQPGQRGQRDVLPYGQGRGRCPRPCGPRAAGRRRPGSRRPSSRVRSGAPATVTRPPSSGSAPAMALAVSRAARRRAARRGRRPRRAGPSTRDAVELVPARSGPSRSSTGARPRASCVAGELGDALARGPRPMSRPSISETSRSRSSSASGPVCTTPAVAQHGDPVADPVQLVEPVADVDHRDALRRAAAR